MGLQNARERSKDFIALCHEFRN